MSGAANRRPLPSPPERSDAGDMGGGSARRRSRARIRGGHQSGRFLSADPYVQYPLWGQSLNRYSYGFNNPLSGSDPTGYSWFSDILSGDTSSDWQGSSYFAGVLAITGGAYVSTLAQVGTFAQGGSLSGFSGGSGLGGRLAVAEAIHGLSDPGANDTYAAPTGELGQGGLYNEGAGAAPPRAEGALAAGDEWCAGKWTEQGCSYHPYDNLGGLAILPAFGDMARAFQAAWSWAFGPSVIVKPGKWDYFYGRVKTGPQHNIDRSAQNLKDLNTLGFNEAAGGRAALMELFKASKALPEAARHITQYGVTITRTARIGDVGAIHIKYFYPGGNLSAVPEISTIIPIVF